MRHTNFLKNNLVRVELKIPVNTETLNIIFLRSDFITVCYPITFGSSQCCGVNRDKRRPLITIFCLTLNFMYGDYVDLFAKENVCVLLKSETY